MPLLLVASAFFVRLLFNVSMGGIAEPGFDGYTDAMEYDALGLSIASGSGYLFNESPRPFRAPGYPFFLAAVYALFGHSYAAVKVAQSLLGALTCLIVFLIGERLFGRRVGVIAAAIAVAYPYLVVYTGLLLSETLFVFLSTLLLYVLVRVREHCTAGRLTLAGLILGMMNLTRPVALLLSVLLFFWGWVEFGTKKQAAAIAGMMTVWMMVPILPWAARNYLVTHSFVLVSDHSWLTLNGSNNRRILQNPEAIGGWWPDEQHESLATPEAHRSAYLAFLKHYLAHEPMELVRLEFHKFKRFWNIFPKTTLRDGVISFFSYGLLLPLFITGMILSRQLPQTPWILFVWIVYFTLMALIFFGSTRFRLPVEPVIILFGALALERLWNRSVGRCAA
jgi:4-amino-4-deoxy-L-arabinose transferase-like glycosyltransferase